MNQLKKKWFLDTLKKKEKTKSAYSERTSYTLIVRGKNNQNSFIWLLQDPRFIF